eukprot:1442641-Rhodomonas_salina.1
MVQSATPQGRCYGMSGAKLPHCCTCLRRCYGMSGTKLAGCYGMSRTELAGCYGMSRTELAGCYGMSGTELAYGGTGETEQLRVAWLPEDSV